MNWKYSIAKSYQSNTLVPNAQKNPNISKLNSNELHKQRPIVIGIMENFVQQPWTKIFCFFFNQYFWNYLLVLSLRIIRLIITVNNGEEDFIVATNDTAIYFNAIKPKTIVTHRNAPINIISRNTFFIIGEFLCKGLWNLFIICIWIQPVITDITSWFVPLLNN